VLVEGGLDRVLGGDPLERLGTEKIARIEAVFVLHLGRGADVPARIKILHSPSERIRKAQEREDTYEKVPSLGQVHALGVHESADLVADEVWVVE
jgi:hypothetical protein